jgi:hypothetical protein
MNARLHPHSIGHIKKHTVKIYPETHADFAASVPQSSMQLRTYIDPVNLLAELQIHKLVPEKSKEMQTNIRQQT